MNPRLAALALFASLCALPAQATTVCPSDHPAFRYAGPMRKPVCCKDANSADCIDQPFLLSQGGTTSSLLNFGTGTSVVTNPCPATHPIYRLVVPFAQKQCCQDQQDSYKCIDSKTGKPTIMSAPVTTPAKPKKKTPTGSGNGNRTGNGNGTRTVTNPDATSGWGKGWIEAVTPLTDWRYVETMDKKVTAYCYIGSLSEKKPTLRETMVASGVSGLFTCVALKAAPQDAVEQDGENLFRQRAYSGRARLMFSNQNDIKAADNKLELIRNKVKTEVMEMPLVGFDPATHVKAVLKFSPPKPLTISLFTDPEKAWLNLDQKAQLVKDEATAKAKTPASAAQLALGELAKTYRALVRKNMRPEKQSAYDSATRAGSAADIAASLGDPWGGKVDKPVAPAGDDATNPLLKEIQLTTAEMTAFQAAKATEAEDFIRKRIPASGGKAGGTFLPDQYNFVTLHDLTVAARAAMTPAVTTPDAGGPQFAAEPKDQSDQFAKYMTAKELAAYKAGLAGKTGDALKAYNAEQLKKIAGRTAPPQFDAEAKDQSDQFAPFMKEDELAAYKAGLSGKTGDALLAYNASQLAKINGRKAYDAKSVNKDNFDGLEAWQKERFCKDFRKGSSAPAGPKKHRRSGRGPTALDEAQTCSADMNCDTLGATNQDAGVIGGGPTGWAADKCKAVELGTTNNPGNGNGNLTTTVPSPTGKETGADKDSKGAKKDNPWLAPGHLYNGAKGALLGAVIGTFFGPLGVLVGALAGAAVAYGISRITGAGDK